LRRNIICLLLLGGILSQSSAQITMSGGKGLLRVKAAETIDAGDLYINAFASAYAEKVDGSLAKDYTGIISLTYGLHRNLELNLQLVPYQDDQRHIWGPPGDTQIGAKWWIPLGRQKTLYWALRGFFVLPTAQHHDVAYEPFSNEGIAWGLEYLITLDLTPLLATFPLKLHFNFGYIDHDIRDTIFEEREDQFLVGGGFKFPIRSLVFFTEFTTEQFFRRDDLSFFENSTRLTPGVVFVGPKRLIFDVAVDIGLSGDDPNTPTVPKHYADWKVIAGVTHYFPLRKHLQRIAEERRRRKAQEEQRRKLREIMEKRAKADEELEKMKKILEKKK